MNHFDGLPREILLLIFLDLHYTELVRIKSVCKLWNDVLESYPIQWNKTIELDCRSTQNVSKIEKNTHSILQRSGGEIQS